MSDSHGERCFGYSGYCSRRNCRWTGNVCMYGTWCRGVQVGSRFAASLESSAHENFKQRIINTDEGSTVLTLKEITPVRMIKMSFMPKWKKRI